MSKIKRFAKLLIVTMLLGVFLIGQLPMLGGLGNLGGLLGGLGGGLRKKAPANIFKKVLSGGDWNLAAGVLCPAGVWTVIGSYTVPAQQAYRFGFGSAAFPDNQGYLYIVVYDDTATDSVEEEGSIRLVQRNAQGTIQLVVAEFRTEQLKGSVNNRQLMVALPEQAQFPLVGEDSVLEVQFKADNADTTCLWGAAVTSGTFPTPDACNVPVTVYQ